MVFGTFDMIHAGHVDLFRQARTLADDVHLIVSVARDANVARIKKQRPRNDELRRVGELQKSGYADEVVLSGESDHVPHILSARPDIIALGYDQEGEYVNGLQEMLKKKGLSVRIVRLEPHYPDTFKTSKLIR